MNLWRNIFEQSRVNNGLYLGDRFPLQNWQWPCGTWFQKRLCYLRNGNLCRGDLLETNLS
jgi:hypothetical protein